MAQLVNYKKFREVRELIHDDNYDLRILSPKLKEDGSREWVKAYSDIHLSDVLQALSNAEDLSVLYMCDHEGELYKMRNKNIELLNVQWSMNEPHLEHQPEVLLDLLITTLKR